MSDIRSKIRSNTIGKASKFASEVIEINGEEIEVRQPSVKTRSILMKKSRETTSNKVEVGDVSAEDVLQSIDYGKMQVLSVIYCTFVPGTDERVFSEEDYDALINQPAGGFVDDISTVAMDLMNAKPEEEAKN